MPGALPDLGDLTRSALQPRPHHKAVGHGGRHVGAAARPAAALLPVAAAILAAAAAALEGKDQQGKGRALARQKGLAAACEAGGGSRAGGAGTVEVGGRGIAGYTHPHAQRCALVAARQARRRAASRAHPGASRPAAPVTQRSGSSAEPPASSMLTRPSSPAPPPCLDVSSGLPCGRGGGVGGAKVWGRAGAGTVDSLRGLGRLSWVHYPQHPSSSRHAPAGCAAARCAAGRARRGRRPRRRPRPPAPHTRARPARSAAGGWVVERLVGCA